ncbi:guanylate kinase [Candidatus Dependentiae bacterium]|nr:guanylate kinase [Candidatus Dependentiae bacterium]
MLSKFFILIGPSGVGKSTLMQQLINEGFPIMQLVTYTTRPKRSYEVDKKDYCFLTIEEFTQKMEQNEVLFPEKVYNNFYGPPKKLIETNLKNSQPIIAAISYDIAQKIQQLYGKEKVVTIYICPPSVKELLSRLQMRNTENKEMIEKRITQAEEELKKQDLCDHKIINDKLDQAFVELKNICGFF